MSTFIQPTDFINKYTIANDQFTSAMLAEFVNDEEIRTLYALFGKTMADLFIADSGGGVPSDANYLLLYQAIQLTNNSCLETYSSGMKEMLKAFTYVSYNNRAAISTTTLGNKHPQTSVSTEVSGFNHYYANIYNLGVANFTVIQTFICENSADYPDYDGSHINYMDGLLFK